MFYMPYLIISLFSLIKYRKGHSLTFFLNLILLISSISAFLVGRQPDIFELDVLFYTIYIAILLFVLFNSFKEYRNVASLSVDSISPKCLKIFEHFAIFISTIIIFLYLFVLYHSLTALTLQSVTVNEFKNDDDGATELLDSLFPHVISTFMNFFNSFAFFDLALHFYYLTKKNRKKTLLYFALSLLLPLSGFVSLSRAASVQYVLLYASLYFFMYKAIDLKIRKKFNRVIIVFISLVSVIFAFISISRFSEYYTKESKQDAIISEMENPLLFSLFDYFSQWQENGPEILKIYHPDNKFYGMYNSSGLALQIKRRITNKDEVTLMARKVERIMGRQWMMFHGLIARLVYDFGFVGSLVFILFFYRIIRFFEPQRGVLNLNSLFVLTVLLPLPLMSFQGNVLGGLASNMALIYLFLMLKFIKANKKKVVNCNMS